MSRLQEMEGLMNGEAYKKSIKHALIDKGITQVELFRQVTEKTGLYCDNSMLRKIIIGKINGTKIRAAINEILNLREGE